MLEEKITVIYLCFNIYLFMLFVGFLSDTDVVNEWGWWLK
jgi:hypothetical protein